MGGIRAGGGQGGPEARCAGDWVRTDEANSHGLRSVTTGLRSVRWSSQRHKRREEVLGALSVTNALDWLVPRAVERFAT